MLIITGFLAPYLIAIAVFPLLAGRPSCSWLATLVACFLILCSPWLIPIESQMLRLLASMTAAMLAIKVIDVWTELRRQGLPTWHAYIDFLANPFTLVRRCLSQERQPTSRESLLSLVTGSIGCAAGIALLVVFFKLDWSGWSFLTEHVAKVIVLMVAITSGLSAAAATWRIAGGTARDFMDMPFAAVTPADFWRRYNRNVQQFFWQDVFKANGGRRAPIQTMLFVFLLSAMLHELIFFASIGRVQGYQTAFFLVQGIAAASTAKIKARGWCAIACMASTLAFNLVSSVLFFASIHGVVPFYSNELPEWLRGW